MLLKNVLLASIIAAVQGVTLQPSLNIPTAVIDGTVPPPTTTSTTAATASVTTLATTQAVITTVDHNGVENGGGHGGVGVVIATSVVNTQVTVTQEPNPFDNSGKTTRSINTTSTTAATSSSKGKETSFTLSCVVFLLALLI